MDNFIMKTDRRLRLLPQIQFSKEGIGTNVMKQSIAYVKEYTGRCIDYPDYLEKPYPLIADKYRKILQKYQTIRRLLSTFFFNQHHPLKIHILLILL